MQIVIKMHFKVYAINPQTSKQLTNQYVKDGKRTCKLDFSEQCHIIDKADNTEIQILTKLKHGLE